MIRSHTVSESNLFCQMPLSPECGNPRYPAFFPAVDRRTQGAYNLKNTSRLNAEKAMKTPFDFTADNYDLWYDTPEGQAAFQGEWLCIRDLMKGSPSGWLEAGTGTGRFAHALAIGTGIDLSSRMLRIGRQKGLRLCQGRAEALPFPSAAFQGVLFALALCFMDDAKQALQEAARVLMPGGQLLIGMIVPESRWGGLWKASAHKGHPLYSRAHFRSITETVALAEQSGFLFTDARSALRWEPGTVPQEPVQALKGIHPAAGFAALSFERIPG